MMFLVLPPLPLPCWSLSGSTTASYSLIPCKQHGFHQHPTRRASLHQAYLHPLTQQQQYLTAANQRFESPPLILAPIQDERLLQHRRNERTNSAPAASAAVFAALANSYGHGVRWRVPSSPPPPTAAPSTTAPARRFGRSWVGLGLPLS